MNPRDADRSLTPADRALVRHEYRHPDDARGEARRPRAARRLHGAFRALARESLQEARRSVHALRPRALTRTSLCAALRELLQKMTADPALDARFAMEGAPGGLSPAFEENLLRICQEVLTNTLRHAAATRFTCQLHFTPEAVRFDLRDDGRGFDPGAAHEGFGLLGIKERVQQMEGELTIRSAPGEGMQMTIRLPLAAASDRTSA